MRPEGAGRPAAPPRRSSMPRLRLPLASEFDLCRGGFARGHRSGGKRVRARSPRLAFIQVPHLAPARGRGIALRGRQLRVERVLHFRAREQHHHHNRRHHHGQVAQRSQRSKRRPSSARCTAKNTASVSQIQRGASSMCSARPTPTNATAPALPAEDAPHGGGDQAAARRSPAASSAPPRCPARGPRRLAWISSQPGGRFSVVVEDCASSDQPTAGSDAWIQTPRATRR
jgi:hypothetical protein